VSSKLGTNIDAIAPIKSAKGAVAPLLVLSATRDEYIAVTHGQRFCTEWGGGYVHFAAFDGGHFGARPTDVVLLAVEHVRRFVVCQLPFQGGTSEKASTDGGGTDHSSSPVPPMMFRGGDSDK
jgi:hypothetical protein